MAAPLAGWSGAADPIVAWNITVVRGFIPAGLRSSPKTIQRGDSVRSGKQDLRLLRSRTGINPLATGDSFRLFMAGTYCGEGFIPAGLRSSPETTQRGDSVRSGKQGLRLLRSRTGINPLTTWDSFQIFRAAPLAGWSGAADPIVAWNMTVVRGFIPAGLRSSPETTQRGDSVRSGKQDLRLLRSRTGINPLATGDSFRLFMAGTYCGEGIHPRWVAKQPRNHSAR